jgi:hypothetical protein
VPTPTAPTPTAPTAPTPTPTAPTPTAPPTTPAPIQTPTAPTAPETSLYQFTEHTFTNAGAEGRTGPTLAQIRNAYSSISWAKDYITMVNNDGIQLWTVPKTGNYLILARGASGLGTGAVIDTFINLVKNDIIKILVGQMGIQNENIIDEIPLRNTGGGGGTFVVYNNNKPIIIAGGGGGNSNFHAISKSNANSSYGNNGKSGSGSGAGSGGSGGNGGKASNSSAGGGGLISDGENCIINATGGKAFINGGVGGTSGNSNKKCDGGFGGGGGCDIDWPSGGGGGGGYSGGGGGGPGRDRSSASIGGGGGSYCEKPNEWNFSLASVPVGHGIVVITLI